MDEKSIKPTKAKPVFYANHFEHLQQIARELGYNLLLHGSINRDMDIVAVPWVDEPASHTKLLKSFCEYLGIPFLTDTKDNPCHFSILPGGRFSYILDLNRGGKHNGYVDEQWYIDLSITPLFGQYWEG